MEILYVVALLISCVAAVLAWAAKLRWASEYKAATERVIEAKDANIAALETEVDALRDLSPIKIREYFNSVKEQLEEYNDLLQEQLSATEEKLAEKQKELAGLREAEEIALTSLEQVERERDDLETAVDLLSNELHELTIHADLAAPLLQAPSQASEAFEDLVEQMKDMEWVEVTEGAFRGVRGVILERRGLHRVLVGLPTIGQGLEIDIHRRILKPLEKPG